MTHSKTIKKFVDLRPHIELKDERFTVDKSKETDKMAFHVESTSPLPPIMRNRWLRAKFHRRTKSI